MSHVMPEMDKKDQASTMSHVIPEKDKKDQASTMSHVIPGTDKTPTMLVKVLHSYRKAFLDYRQI